MIGKNYLINLATRPDRLQHSQQELSRVGLGFERFEAHTGPDRFLAFNSSQYHCLKKAVDDGYSWFTIYEDDVIFGPYGHATEAINQLPMDFDILQLGCNLIGSDVTPFEKPGKYSENLFLLRDAWQTQSVVYSRKCAEWILANWNYLEFPIYDEWLRLNVYRTHKCFVVAPQLTYQIPGISNIWNDQFTNYTSLFSSGNKLMQ